MYTVFRFTLCVNHIISAFLIRMVHIHLYMFLLMLICNFFKSMPYPYPIFKKIYCITCQYYIITVFSICIYVSQHLIHDNTKKYCKISSTHMQMRIRQESRKLYALQEYKQASFMLSNPKTLMYHVIVCNVPICYDRPIQNALKKQSLKGCSLYQIMIEKGQIQYQRWQKRLF